MGKESVCTLSFFSLLAEIDGGLLHPTCIVIVAYNASHHATAKTPKQAFVILYKTSWANFVRDRSHYVTKLFKNGLGPLKTKSSPNTSPYPTPSLEAPLLILS